MTITSQIAKHLRDVHFGGNWTTSNLKENLENLTWHQATTQVYSFNTIARLVFHINYYISAVSKLLDGDKLNAHDKYSFDLPPITCEEDWQKLKDKTFTDVEKFCGQIAQLPDSILWEYLAEEKYGTYYRNLNGIIEHTHYHLGQIVLIRKVLLEESKA